MVVRRSPINGEECLNLEVIEPISSRMDSSDGTASPDPTSLAPDRASVRA